MNHRPDGPYRDASLGIEARATELRARWTRAAALVPQQVVDVVKARHGRIGSGVAAGIAYGLMVAYVIHSAIESPPRPAHQDPKAMMVDMMFVPFGAAYLFVAVALFKLAASKLAKALAGRRVRALLAGPGPAHVANVEWFANLTPHTIVARHAARVESASLLLPLVTDPWCTYWFSYVAVAQVVMHRHGRGSSMGWFAFMAVMVSLQLAAILVTRYSLRQVGVISAPTVAGVVGLLALASLLARFVSSDAILGVAVGLLAVGLRAFCLRVDILRERGILSADPPCE